MLEPHLPHLAAEEVWVGGSPVSGPGVESIHVIHEKTGAQRGQATCSGPHSCSVDKGDWEQLSCALLVPRAGGLPACLPLCSEASSTLCLLCALFCLLFWFLACQFLDLTHL